MLKLSMMKNDSTITFSKIINTKILEFLGIVWSL